MFRFSIRDVLWLTVVVGLSLGWVLDHRGNAKWKSRAECAQRALADNGLSAEWKGDGVIVGHGGKTVMDYEGNDLREREPSEPSPFASPPSLP